MAGPSSSVTTVLATRRPGSRYAHLPTLQDGYQTPQAPLPIRSSGLCAGDAPVGEGN